MGNLKRNENGRPPSGIGATFAEIMAKELNRVYKKPQDDAPPKRMTFKEKLVRTAIQQAAAGNLNALESLMNRVEGKVPDRAQIDVEHSIRVVPWDDDAAPDTEYIPYRNEADAPQSGRLLPPPDATDQTPPWKYRNSPELLDERAEALSANGTWAGKGKSEEETEKPADGDG